jgi:hypothetical protein
MMQRKGERTGQRIASSDELTLNRKICGREISDDSKFGLAVLMELARNAFKLRIVLIQP